MTSTEIQALMEEHKPTSASEIDALLSSGEVSAEQADEMKKALGGGTPQTDEGGLPANYVSRPDLIARSRPITRIERVRYTSSEDGTPVMFSTDTPVEERDAQLKRMIANGDCYGYANLRDGYSVPVNLDLVTDNEGNIRLPRVNDYVRYSILRQGDVIDASKQAEQNETPTARVFPKGERMYMEVKQAMVRVTGISPDLDAFQTSEDTESEYDRLLGAIRDLQALGLNPPSEMLVALGQAKKS